MPVIRDVDRKNIVQISTELQALAEKAKARKLSLDEMEGGSFTISNLGGIGGTYFTPIVNVPEVAILGMSRSVMEPVWKDGAFVPRLMMPLSLSYDHRIIDGADAIRFVRWVCGGARTALRDVAPGVKPSRSPCDRPPVHRWPEAPPGAVASVRPSSTVNGQRPRKWL